LFAPHKLFILLEDFADPADTIQYDTIIIVVNKFSCASVAVSALQNLHKID